MGAYEEESNLHMDEIQETETAAEIGVCEKRDSDLLVGHDVHCAEVVVESEDVGCCGCDHPDPSQRSVDDFEDECHCNGHDNGYRHGGDTRLSSYSRMACLWPGTWKCSLCNCVNHKRDTDEENQAVLDREED